MEVLTETEIHSFFRHSVYIKCSINELMCSVDWVDMDTLCQEVKLYRSMPLKKTNAYQYEEKRTSKRHQMEWNHIVCDESYLLLPHQRDIQRYHFMLLFTTTSSFVTLVSSALFPELFQVRLEYDFASSTTIHFSTIHFEEISLNLSIRYHVVNMFLHKEFMLTANI